LDVETIKQSNGKLAPYLICAYNGTDYITSYDSNQKSLFTTFFDKLLSQINPGSTAIIYAHNLSGFDGIFLMKHLLSVGKVEPLLFHGKLMSIKVIISGNNKTYNKTIEFKDSYLLLPLSLRKLCLAFKVDLVKGYFPFNLTNIYYTGVFPKFEHWTDISLSEYTELSKTNKGKFWSFQQEAIKYCKLDCKCLYEVLIKFNKLIFNEFKVNIHKSPSLPALAMRIYKTQFMPLNSIYQILGKPEQAIRNSYSGARSAGAVDVYIPHNRITPFIGNIESKFKQLFYYDVNSLYPTIMAKHLMPIGRPIYFEGDIRNIDPDAYGFFYCKITSPEYLEHPILQRRIKTSEGIRTIAGLGTWSDWISSIEMDNAIKLGYTFEILKGYQFETGDLFSSYVNRMYALRKQYPKGDAMNLIAKLLMNSLYGKFGMKMEMTRIDIYDCSTQGGKDHFKEIINQFGESIQDYVKIDDNFLIIRNCSMDVKYDEESDMYHGQDVNIAIASAITAGARVHMSLFKNNSYFNLYYSDTDSIV
jgi:hypothetical protein